jgi:hypothetical protein
LELNHKQVEVYNPILEEKVEIDEGMVELLTLMWEMGLLTSLSCQENKPGVMWVSMPSEDASWFMTALSSKRDDDLASDSSSLYKRMMGLEGEDNWDFQVRPQDVAESYLFDQEGFDADEDGFEDDFVTVAREGISKIYFDINIRFPITEYPIILQRLKEYKRNMDKLK